MLKILLNRVIFLALFLATGLAEPTKLTSFVGSANPV